MSLHLICTLELHLLQRRFFWLTFTFLQQMPHGTLVGFTSFQGKQIYVVFHMAPEIIIWT